MPRELTEFNHRHVAIAEYLLMNPAARLIDIATAVGLSPAWVSTLTSSEFFRNYMLERSKEIGGPEALTLKEKVQAAAHLAVEKLTVSLEHSEDPAFFLEAADKTLKRLGMGGPQVAIQNNTTVEATVVSPEVLARAREKMYELAQRSSPERLPASGGGCEGEVLPAAAAGASVQEVPEREPKGGAAVRAEGSGEPGSA